MLKIDIRPGDEIQVGDAVIRMVHKSGQVACLVIDAPKTLPIKRTKAREAEACTIKAQMQA